MDVQVKRALNLKFKELRFTALRMHWDRTGPSGGPMDASERDFYDLIQVLELVAFATRTQEEEGPCSNGCRSRCLSALRRASAEEALPPTSEVKEFQQWPYSR